MPEVGSPEDGGQLVENLKGQLWEKALSMEDEKRRGELLPLLARSMQDEIKLRTVNCEVEWGNRQYWTEALGHDEPIIDEFAVEKYPESPDMVIDEKIHIYSLREKYRQVALARTKQRVENSHRLMEELRQMNQAGTWLEQAFEVELTLDEVLSGRVNQSERYGQWQRLIYKAFAPYKHDVDFTLEALTAVKCYMTRREAWRKNPDESIFEDSKEAMNLRNYLGDEAENVVTNIDRMLDEVAGQRQRHDRVCRDRWGEEYEAVKNT